MAFDLAELRDAVARHGRVARVVIAEVTGSAPRDVGAAMLVWDGGQSGTIGGGALEYEAAGAAWDRQGATRHPLGPALGQCCGGHVTLWTEQFDTHSLAEIADTPVIARGAGEMPLSVRRMLDAARSRGVTPKPGMTDGWMVEPVSEPRMPVWIWGAGHVGRAIIRTLAPLPDLALTWIDTDKTRFPAEIPQVVTAVPAAMPARLVSHAPKDARHLILTYSHTLDFELCHALLQHRFRFAGLIGSDTKWARFRKRLSALGHTAEKTGQITCPIGAKHLGKHPQAIAIGVAAEILETLENQGVDGCQTRSSA